jgi:glycosyltransferase involved in cell wall biosynthesis
VRSRLIRLIPPNVRSRLRARRYGRVGRWNVDIVTDRAASTWRRRTPRTVRVLPLPTEGPPATKLGDPRAAALAERALGADGVEVAFAGPARPARPWERSSEPLLDPRGAALTDAATERYGTGPVAALFERLRDAGERIAFVPMAGNPQRLRRTDRIDRPAVVILSLVPMHDLGGGGRPAQLAMALLGAGFHVTVIHLHGAAGDDHGIRFLHPHLEQRWSWDVVVDDLAERAERPAFVLVEAPAPELIDLAHELRRHGFALVYDVIDDWSGEGLGWDWYDAGAERTLVETADLLTASATPLVERIAAIGRPATLVANGVNEAVFGGPPAPRPAENPPGTVIGYHGTLRGSWIDWKAIDALAAAFPEAHVVLVGDAPQAIPNLPPNVALVGSRPQVELPRLIGGFDVGIVPFSVSETTHAVSPLKVYEYLACGVPVAAPPLRSLRGLDGVHTDPDLVTAVRRALDGPAPDRDRALVEHGWSARVDLLLDALGVTRPDPAEPVHVEVRPAVDWR